MLYYQIIHSILKRLKIFFPLQTFYLCGKGFSSTSTKTYYAISNSEVNVKIQMFSIKPDIQKKFAKLLNSIIYLTKLDLKYIVVFSLKNLILTCNEFSIVHFK